MTSLLNIPGFRVVCKVHESSNSVAFQAKREQDGVSVILKLSKEEYPLPKDVVKFKREFEIGQSLQHISSVAQILGIEKVNNKLALVMEDFGGQSLRTLLRQQRRLSLEEGLSIAIQVTDALGQVHEAQIIHKDINPANVVYNPETGVAKIIDFGIASLVQRESPGFESVEMLEGTLAYISPEQTGRVNHSVDYRTDYYSLGAMLYELFTGQPPFEAKDMNDLILSQLARHPVPPHERNLAIPATISDIILKLMAKSPEDRYQSAVGIKIDLEECLHRLRTAGSIAPFPLGAHDFSDKLSVPEKLYGREQEMEQISRIFEQGSQSQKALLLISGYSGIGKTVLVKQLFPALALKDGHFVSGKFDQLQRSKPYTAFINALAALVRKLLSLDERTIADYTHSLKEALGVNGQVMVDLIPELSLILGRQEPLPEVSPAERQNRFNLVFQKFIGVFGKPEHPLVIFIDDLQWADIASLHLLELCLTSPQIQCVTFVGAYRDNEVGPGHPLQLTLEEMERSRVLCSRIAISPLSVQPVNELLRDTLKCPLEETRSLAELLTEKTGGNPFFLKEYLGSLHDEGLLSIDRRNGVWSWELARIRAKGITDNVADLLVGKMQRLEPDALNLLKLCACLGNKLDIRTLSWVSGGTPPETIKGLYPSVNAGFLIPLSNAYKAVEQGEYAERGEERVEYRFAHDRIQQAAYSMIPEDARGRLHLTIGREVLAHTDDQEREVKLFEIVDHLLLGRGCLESGEERSSLCRYLLQAGRKAKDSAAYPPAMGYLKAALELAPKSFWDEQHELMLALYTEAAEAAYLVSDHVGMDAYVNEALPRARSVLERIRLLDVRIHSSIQRDRHVDAIGTALEVLRLLDIRFPRRPTLLHAALSLLKVNLTLLRKSPARWLALPRTTDPHAEAAVRIIVTIGSVTYITNPNLYVLLVLRSFELAVKKGNCAFSAVPYTGVGVLLCGILGDIQKGYEYGQLAVRVLEKFPNKALRGYVVFVVNTLIYHWKIPLKDTLGGFLDGYESALETGDHVFVCHNATNYGYHMFMAGTPLATVDSEFRRFKEIVRRFDRQVLLQTQSIFHQAALNFLGQAKHPTLLVGESYDELQMASLHQGRGEKYNLMDMYFNKMMLCCFFHHHEEGIVATDAARELLPNIVSTYTFAAYHFYDSLLALGSLAKATAKERVSRLRRVAANQKKLRKWSQHATANLLHKYLLVEAERLRLKGKLYQSVPFYDRAIQLAREHEFFHEEGLACELAAIAHFHQKRSDIGFQYLKDARYAYLKWGAKAKVIDIDEKWGARGS